MNSLTDEQRERTERNREAARRKRAQAGDGRKHARRSEESDDEFISSAETSVTPAAKRSTPSIAESSSDAQPVPLQLPETQISESQEADLDRVEAEAAAAAVSPVARRRESSLGYSQEWADEDFQGEALAGLDAVEADAAAQCPSSTTNAGAAMSSSSSSASAATRRRREGSMGFSQEWADEEFQGEALAGLDAAEAAAQQLAVDSGAESEEVPTDVDEPAAAPPATAAVADHLPLRLCFARMLAEQRGRSGLAEALLSDYKAGGLEAVDKGQAAQELGLPRLHVPSPGSVLLYHAKAQDVGHVTCWKMSAHGRTIAHDVLGQDNLLRVNFQFERDQELVRNQGKRIEVEMLGCGLELAGRTYGLLKPSVDPKSDPDFVAAPGQHGALKWQTAGEARQLLADFESIQNVSKYATRPKLAFSQTFDVSMLLGGDGPRLKPLVVVPPEGHRRGAALRGWLRAQPAAAPGQLRIVEVDDELPANLTDGHGQISADLADAIPLVIKKQHDDTPRIEPLEEAWHSRKAGGGPLITQLRLWYLGSLAKGAVTRIATLPARAHALVERLGGKQHLAILMAMAQRSSLDRCIHNPGTLVLRDSMIKVHGRPNCAARRRGFWSCEVVETSDSHAVCRTNPQLIPLLEALGGEAAVAEIVRLGEAFRQRTLQLLQPPVDLKLLQELAESAVNDSERAVREGGEPALADPFRMLLHGFDLRHEPYLAQQVTKLIENRLVQLRRGSVPIPDSAMLFGAPDPSGTLAPGTACCCIDSSIGSAHHGREVLLYRAPGVHPGDVRRVRLVPPAPELRQMLEGAGDRSNGIFFSIQGGRSLADEMAGGDFDGDKFYVIWDSGLVAACPCASAPWCEAEQEAMLEGLRGRPMVCSSMQLPPEGEGEKRARALAGYVLQAREQKHVLTQASSDWFVVAELHGAAHPEALKRAYVSMCALDAAKTGQQVSVPPGTPSLYPKHLQHVRTFADKLANSKTQAIRREFLQRFRREAGDGQQPSLLRSSALAQMAALDGSSGPPPLSKAHTQELCQTSHYMPMLPHESWGEGRSRHAEFLQMTEMHRERFNQYLQTCAVTLPKGDEKWTDEMRTKLKQMIKTDRDLFLGEATDAEIENPRDDSRLLASAFALYMVVHQAHFGRGKNVTYAWRVAGDFILEVQERRRQREARALAPAAPPRTCRGSGVDPMYLAGLIARPRRRPPPDEYSHDQE